MKHIYFDHAASTPVRREVVKAMMPYFSTHFGNPSSLHSTGQIAIAAIDKAREMVAKAINASFREIIFTGSATEANNLALRGAVRVFKLANPNIKPRVIISAIEHESVLETAKDLSRDGVEFVMIPVNENGVIDIPRLKYELNERTVIVSVMYVNNEIGTVEPIVEIASVIKNYKLKIKNSSRSYPLLHTDAVQAFNYFECDVNMLGIDMMTLSGHKIGGPKGVGCLYVKNTKLTAPIITGGGQEFGLRSGTENIACIVGFAEAIKLAIKERKKEYTRLLTLKKYFWINIKKILPDAHVYGFPEKQFAHASPHILNVAWRGAPLDDTLVRLDMMGIAASSGSACASRA
ncbi:MAG: cysteine desulfurase family protein, partial [Patescibacteria group bacterium]